MTLTDEKINEKLVIDKNKFWIVGKTDKNVKKPPNNVTLKSKTQEQGLQNVNKASEEPKAKVSEMPKTSLHKNNSNDLGRRCVNKKISFDCGGTQETSPSKEKKVGILYKLQQPSNEETPNNKNNRLKKSNNESKTSQRNLSKEKTECTKQKNSGIETPDKREVFSDGEVSATAKKADATNRQQHSANSSNNKNQRHADGVAEHRDDGQSVHTDQKSETTSESNKMEKSEISSRQQSLKPNSESQNNKNNQTKHLSQENKTSHTRINARENPPAKNREKTSGDREVHTDSEISCRQKSRKSVTINENGIKQSEPKGILITNQQNKNCEDDKTKEETVSETDETVLLQKKIAEVNKRLQQCDMRKTKPSEIPLRKNRLSKYAKPVSLLLQKSLVDYDSATSDESGPRKRLKFIEELRPEPNVEEEKKPSNDDSKVDDGLAENLPEVEDKTPPEDITEEKPPSEDLKPELTVSESEEEDKILPPKRSLDSVAVFEPKSVVTVLEPKSRYTDKEMSDGFEPSNTIQYLEELKCKLMNTEKSNENLKLLRNNLDFVSALVKKSLLAQNNAVPDSIQLEKKIQRSEEVNIELIYKDKASDNLSYVSFDETQEELNGNQNGDISIRRCSKITPVAEISNQELTERGSRAKELDLEMVKSSSFTVLKIQNTLSRLEFLHQQNVFNKRNSLYDKNASALKLRALTSKTSVNSLKEPTRKISKSNKIKPIKQEGENCVLVVKNSSRPESKRDMERNEVMTEIFNYTNNLQNAQLSKATAKGILYEGETDYLKRMNPMKTNSYTFIQSNLTESPENLAFNITPKVAVKMKVDDPVPKLTVLQSEMLVAGLTKKRTEIEPNLICKNLDVERHKSKEKTLSSYDFRNLGILSDNKGKGVGYYRSSPLWSPTELFEAELINKQLNIKPGNIEVEDFQKSKWTTPPTHNLNNSRNLDIVLKNHDINSKNDMRPSIYFESSHPWTPPPPPEDCWRYELSFHKNSSSMSFLSNYFKSGYSVKDKESIESGKFTERPNQRRIKNKKTESTPLENICIDDLQVNCKKNMSSSFLLYPFKDDSSKLEKSKDSMEGYSSYDEAKYKKIKERSAKTPEHPGRKEVTSRKNISSSSLLSKYLKNKNTANGKSKESIASSKSHKKTKQKIVKVKTKENTEKKDAVEPTGTEPKEGNVKNDGNIDTSSFSFLPNSFKHKNSTEKKSTESAESTPSKKTKTVKSKHKKKESANKENAVETNTKKLKDKLKKKESQDCHSPNEFTKSESGKVKIHIDINLNPDKETSKSEILESEEEPKRSESSISPLVDDSKLYEDEYKRGDEPPILEDTDKNNSPILENAHASENSKISLIKGKVSSVDECLDSIASRSRKNSMANKKIKEKKLSTVSAKIRKNKIASDAGDRWQRADRFKSGMKNVKADAKIRRPSHRETKTVVDKCDVFDEVQGLQLRRRFSEPYSFRGFVWKRPKSVTPKFHKASVSSMASSLRHLNTDELEDFFVWETIPLKMTSCWEMSLYNSKKPWSVLSCSVFNDNRISSTPGQILKNLRNDSNLNHGLSFIWENERSSKTKENSFDVEPSIAQKNIDIRKWLAALNFPTPPSTSTDIISEGNFGTVIPAAGNDLTKIQVSPKRRKASRGLNKFSDDILHGKFQNKKALKYSKKTNDGEVKGLKDLIRRKSGGYITFEQYLISEMKRPTEQTVAEPSNKKSAGKKKKTENKASQTRFPLSKEDSELSQKHEITLVLSNFSEGRCSPIMGSLTGENEQEQSARTGIGGLLKLFMVSSIFLLFFFAFGNLYYRRFSSPKPLEE